MAKDKAEMSTTIANILGDAIVPGLFNLVGCVVSFIAFQYFCFTHFCRVTQNKYGRFTLQSLPGELYTLSPYQTFPQIFPNFS